jgi:hypothetical protein
MIVGTLLKGTVAVADTRTKLAQGRFKFVSNQLVSIHRRLRQMKSEPQFRGYFPPEPPSISLDDPDAVRANFSKIASGEVIVKK